MPISKTATANLYLSMAALLWGSAFIFQRQAMDHLSPLAYGGLRFTLGALCLLPLTLPRMKKLLSQTANRGELGKLWLSGSLASGGLIFLGATFQQYGLIWTTAGKAGFITSLYVVIVPLILRLMGHRIVVGEALGATLAVVGLYFLSFVPGVFNLSLGDSLVLVSALIWAGQVLAVGWYAPKMDALVLGTGQALVCGLLSLVATVLAQQWPSWSALEATWLDIVWGGVFSVALGFTFQVVGQVKAKPAPAAIIMQMEAVVAALAGWLFLNEMMSARMVFGAGLMLAGMLICQLWPIVASGRKAASLAPKSPPDLDA